MTLLLTRSEVATLLDLQRAMLVLEQTFREQSAGQVKPVAPLRFMNRGMRMVVGGLEAQDKNGFRVSVTGGDSLAMLFEISSGKLLCLTGYPFSNLRIDQRATRRFSHRAGALSGDTGKIQPARILLGTRSDENSLA
ncbi:MAG TPA: hypothetical protein VFY96_13175 [Candidatus Binatia bacterium]|nr:hypothetical protein [Candidatus Binatia bacterium]